MRFLALPLLLLASGCFRLTDEELDAAMDQDGDGWKDSAFGGEDCDGSNAAVNPDAVEVCNGVDDDCDGTTDGEAATDILTWYRDRDEDGFGDADTPSMACEQPSGAVANADDCDDSDVAVHPDADEVCNGVDDDCDDSIDEDDAAPGTWYQDADGDGYGDDESLVETCEPDDDYVTVGGDCDDSDDTINPDADEICDGLVDENCDGEVDEDTAIGASSWYPDDDSDGWGDDGGTAVTACDAPSGYAEGGDCDDTNGLIFPGADEVCDEWDNDCDSSNDYDSIVPTDVFTIQGAVDAASSGDRICVLDGTYTGRLIVETEVVVEGESRDGVIVDAEFDGAALEITGAPSGTEVRSMTFSNGEETWQGSGFTLTSTEAHLEDLLFTGNTLTSSSQCLGGVGYVLGDYAPTMSHIDIVANDIDCGLTWGIVYFRSIPDTMFLDHIRVVDNTMVSRDYREDAIGGVLSYFTDVELSNAIFAGNSFTIEDSSASSSLRGQAIGGVGANWTVRNITVHGNDMDPGDGEVYGGQVHADGGSTIAIDNASITVNQTSGTVDCSVSSGNVTFRYSNLWNNSGSDHCDTSPTTGMLAEDPLYTDVSSSDPTDWELTLSSSSGLIDNGDPTTALKDDDGTQNDIGAYGGPGSDW